MCRYGTNEVRQKKLVSALNLKSAETQVLGNGVLNCFVFIGSKIYDIMIIHRRNMKLKVPVYDCINFNKKMFYDAETFLLQMFFSFWCDMIFKIFFFQITLQFES